MCGFAGVAWHGDARPIDMDLLVRMRDTIRHRGPDDSGAEIADGVALASRRLAILDLSARGAMPMSTRDGRYSIIYNGEIYNYRDLRRDLKARGCSFESDTDTEVLLQLYVQHGAAMLERLNGMFALAIWDASEEKLFLARDRTGIKPLYYSLQGGAIWFGSEQKSLFASGLEAHFDTGVWEELLCFRYVAGERTPFHGVQRLLPAHSMFWQNGNCRTMRWWNLPDRIDELRAGTPSSPEGWFEQTFDDAVDAHRISDVPVGVLLSGGLDSSAVALSLSKASGRGISSFTVRFDEPGYDEGPLAKLVADAAGLDYHELTVRENELCDLLDEASWLNDEPLAHGNEPHILAISRYAKPLVTVLLSGEGSDEVLGGYVRYQPLLHASKFGAARLVLPPASRMFNLPPRYAKLARFLQLGSLEKYVLYNACDTLPSDLSAIGMKATGSYPFRESVLDEARALYPNEPFRQAMYSDQRTFLCSLLDRNDRMTMGASIECRVPFLDYRLVEGLGAMRTSSLLPNGQGKALLRNTLGKRMPKEILEHHKWGFGSPWSRHFREMPTLREIVATLPDTEPIASGPIDRALLRSVIDRFLSGDQRQATLIRTLVFIAIWYRVYFTRIAGMRSLKGLVSSGAASG